ELKDGAINRITGMYNSVVTWFQNLWTNITNKAMNLKDTVVQRFTELKDNVVSRIAGMYGSVTGWFQNLWSNVTSKATEIKDSVTGSFTTLKDNAINRVTNMYNSVTTWFSNLWTSMTNKATDIKNSVTGSFTTLKNNAINRVTNMYNSVTGWFGDMKTSVTTTATNLKNGVVSKFSSMRDESNQKMIDMFNWVTGKFGKLATWVDGKVTGMKDDTVKAFLWMKDGAIDGVQKLYDGTSDLFDDVKRYAADTIDNMVDGAKKLPGRIGNAIKNMASFAVDGIKSLGNKMGEKLGSVVNGVTGGLNSVLEKIGVTNLIDKISIPTFSTGTHNGAIANDMLGMVNDRGPGNGRGGATQELIQRDGQLFAPRGKNAIVPLKKGDRIFNGAETQSLMSSGIIPRFSRGTGSEGGNTGESKGLLGTLKDVAENVWDYITNPGKAFDAIINAVTPDFSGMAGFAGDFLKGGFNYLTNGVKDFITKVFKENEGGLGSGKGAHFMSFPMTTPYSPNSAVPGYPTSFNGGRHYGIDYGTPIGTPVHATTSGTVSKLHNMGGGLVAKLKTGKLTQFFMHLADIVKTGSVKAGDLIAKTGNSGKWTTGPHIHWQAQQGSDIMNQNTVDPRKVVGHANGGIFSHQHVANFAEE